MMGGRTGSGGGVADDGKKSEVEDVEEEEDGGTKRSVEQRSVDLFGNRDLVRQWQVGCFRFAATSLFVRCANKQNKLEIERPRISKIIS